MLDRSHGVTWGRPGGCSGPGGEAAGDLAAGAAAREAGEAAGADAAAGAVASDYAIAHGRMRHSGERHQER